MLDVLSRKGFLAKTAKIAKIAKPLTRGLFLAISAALRDTSFLCACA